MAFRHLRLNWTLLCTLEGAALIRRLTLSIQWPPSAPGVDPLVPYFA